MIGSIHTPSQDHTALFFQTVQGCSGWTMPKQSTFPNETQPTTVSTLKFQFHLGVRVLLERKWIAANQRKVFVLKKIPTNPDRLMKEAIPNRIGHGRHDRCHMSPLRPFGTGCPEASCQPQPFSSEVSCQPEWLPRIQHWLSFCRPLCEPPTDA